MIINAGYDKSKIALATKAGLKMLLPRPPNNCFPIIIVKNPPSIGIHQGTVGGSVRPNNAPAKKALPSPKILLCVIKGFSKITALTAAAKTK